ncbi:MAG: GNAT family N-acetyltransferase [Desulfobacterales bacterium]|jgi:GNAT superfamily N-acetyltransferase
MATAKRRCKGGHEKMGLVELIAEKDREEAYEILIELVPRLKRAEFLRSFDHELMKQHKLFGLRKVGKLVSVAAAWTLMTGVPEKLLWIYALVTTEPMRSKGHGRALLEALKQYARREGFDEIRAHAHREEAMAFWEEKTEFKKFSMIYRLTANE